MIFKDALREIWRTFGRFASILLIVALGVGFYAGVKVAPTDFRLSVAEYLTDVGMYDVHAIATLGITQDDIADVRDVPGVESVMPSYSADLLMEDGGGKNLVVRTKSIPTNNMNSLDLVEGRAPMYDDECLIVRGEFGRNPAHVGDVVTLYPGNADDDLPLSYDSYLIVGEILSPQFMSFDKGYSNVGSGSVACVLFLMPGAYDYEEYSDLYIRLDMPGSMPAFSEKYHDALEEWLNYFENYGDGRALIRERDVVDKANDKLNDARETLASEEFGAQIKLDDAQSELYSAKEKIDSGNAELEDGKIKAADGEQELNDQRRKYNREIADAEKKLADSQKTLDDGKKRYQDGLKKYNDGKKKYDDGLKKYNDGLEKYNDGLKQYNAGLKKYNDAIKQLEDGEIKYDAGAKSLAAAEREYSAAAAQYAAAQKMGYSDPKTEAQLFAAYQQLAAGEKELAASKKELDAAHAQLGPVKKKLNASKKELSAAKKQLDDSKKKLDSSKKELADAKKKLDDSKKELDSGQKKLDDAKKKLKDAKAEATTEFAKAQRKIDDAKVDIADAEVQLRDGEKAYENGAMKLSDARKEADESIADAHAQIDDAQRKIDDIPKSEWYVSTRLDDPGYSGISQNADRVDTIARIFPLFFILVAGLVCSTNMTRMVEEQRTQIGTLKALGYSPMAIAGKFVVYALAASILGSILGLSVGLRVFPRVIYAAYGMVYDLPQLALSFPPSLMLLSVAVSALLTSLTAILCCLGEMRVSPASLMRPRAPKPGKRILLERIPPLWRSISFSYKVTLRNLFRYKQRILMTVAGIAGCTALMLAGFGLSDSIDGVPKLQYDVIYDYDATILLKDDVKPDERRAILTALSSDDRIYDALPVRDKTFDATNPDGSARVSLECHLLVAEDASALNRMIWLRDRTTLEPVPLKNDATVLTEKIAKTLGITPGGAITLSSGGEKRTFPVDGVAENYLFHYLYASKTDYERYFGTAFEPNSLLIQYAYALSPEESNAFSEEILRMDGVLTVMLQSGVRGTFNSIINGLSAVTMLIIGSAGLLAFVVLYNLITINILERVREIATIKVLGFTPGEVAAYVFRENFIMVLIGLGAGLFAGIYLHQYIISTAEMDQLMFTRLLNCASFVKSSAYTLIFAVCVFAAMYFKLKSINMVESLKSLE